MRIVNSKLLLVLILITMVGFATITPASAIQNAQLGVTTSPPCACSSYAVYTFYLDTQHFSTGVSLVFLGIRIPAGYTVSPDFLTTTEGIVVATGESGQVFPHSNGVPVTVETTTTSGTFGVSVDGNLVGSLTIVLPTATKSGALEFSFTDPMPYHTWAEISFVAGFFKNPCTPGTYTWGPNKAVGYDAQSNQNVDVPVYSDDPLTIQVVLANCAVGGVVTPTNKLSTIAPYLALAGVAAAASVIVVVRRRSEA